MQQQAQQQKKWYQKTYIILVLMIIVWPVGVYLAWKYLRWSKVKKTLVSILTAALVLILGNAILNSTPTIFIFDKNEDLIITDQNPYTLKGRINGGDASVTIGGKSVTTDTLGAFEKNIDLKDGDNKVEITASREGNTNNRSIVIRLNK